MNPSRDHILDTAFRLFFTKGFKEVTMAELVRVSGLSKGAFYHYFESKADLYNSVLEKFLLSNMEHFSAHYDTSASLRENLKALFQQSAGMTEQIRNSDDEASSGMFNYLMFLQRAMQNPLFREKVQEFNLQYENGLADWISIAQQKGEIKKELKPIVLAKHIIGLMKGLTMVYSFISQKEPLSATFVEIIDQFFQQIESHENEQKIPVRP